MTFPIDEQLADNPWETTSDTETPGWPAGPQVGSDGVIGSFCVAGFGSGVVGVGPGVASAGSGVAGASTGVGPAASVVVVPPCHGVTTFLPLAAASLTASSFLEV